jgi:hypothetical protein
MARDPTAAPATARVPAIALAFPADHGRDRGCGRVVLEGLPDPSHDAGRAIPALVLRGFAEIIATYYTASQMAEFLYDSSRSLNGLASC